ncbi:MAG: polysaccharide biosynthesis tyrosine autokinase [Chloroflexi bacterium]|nr:polysaccharide biosynthesis tyrosine autokinase [Chloroflexota bacterium]
MEIKDYLAPLLKWWWLILIATLIAGGSSYLAAKQQSSVYRTSTKLIIGNTIDNPNPSSSELFLSQQLASTYVDLARQDSVLDATMEALEVEWLPTINVFQPNNSYIIEILVIAQNPAFAQTVANELAQQLILRSPTSQEQSQERQEFINRQLDDYEAAITETQTQLAIKNEELGTLVSAREIANLQTEIQTLENNLQNFQSNYALLLQSTERGATNTIRVLEAAALPKSPVDPNNTMSILTAAGIGFVLAVSAAYILEYLDDTVKTPAHIKRLTNLPTLAGIAKISNPDEQLITLKEPRSPISEAFRVLRTGIQFAAIDKPMRSIIVTGGTPGVGKTTISSNLAIILAQAGNRVLLIDGDLRKPKQHELFNVPNSRGLTNLLLFYDKAKEDGRLQQLVEKAVHTSSINELEILTSGPIPPNPSELLGSATMKELMTYLLQEYDYLIFDSPPILAVTDAIILSTQVDATLLVIRTNKSRKYHLQQAVQQLQDVHANIIGCALNSISRRSEAYGAYYYYAHSSHYGSEQSSSDGDDNQENRPDVKKRRLLPGRQ